MLFFVAMCVLMCCSAAQDATIIPDADGNLHINTTSTTRRVFVNGVDIVDLHARIDAATAAIAALQPRPPPPPIVTTHMYGVGVTLNGTSVAFSFNGTSATTLPQPISPRPSIVMVNGTLFAVGAAAVDPTYQLIGSKWELVSLVQRDLTTRDAITVVWRGSILRIGGIGPGGAVISAVNICNMATMRWEFYTITLFAITQTAAVVYGDSPRLYVICGKTDASFTRVTQIFDGLAWTQVVIFDRGLYGHSVVLGGGTFYVFGGLTRRGSLPVAPETSIFRYTDGVMQEISTTHPYGYRAAYGAINGVFFSLGGLTNTSAPVDSIFTWSGEDWVRAQIALPFVFEGMGVSV
jgi:hypothetical protein